jgi:MinD superfamily P-loop ATPase
MTTAQEILRMIETVDPGGAARLEDLECTRCNRAGNPEHCCPYQAEINSDDEYTCNCCDECTYNCAMDI